MTQRQGVFAHRSRSPHLDIADETYVGVPPGTLAPVVADPVAWRGWWPDLHLAVTRDRGVKGQQWAVGGAVLGSMEVWLEPMAQGTVVHWFLRADLARASTPRLVRRERERRVLAWKLVMFTLKDRLEGLKVAGAAADQP